MVFKWSDDKCYQDPLGLQLSVQTIKKLVRNKMVVGEFLLMECTYSSFLGFIEETNENAGTFNVYHQHYFLFCFALLLYAS